MLKKVIACDKCGETITGDYLTVYRIDSGKDAVIGRGDICVWRWFPDTKMPEWATTDKEIREVAVQKWNRRKGE